MLVDPGELAHFGGGELAPVYVFRLGEDPLKLRVLLREADEVGAGIGRQLVRRRQDTRRFGLRAGQQAHAPEFLCCRLDFLQSSAEGRRGGFRVKAARAQGVQVQQRHVPVVRGEEAVEVGNRQRQRSFCVCHGYP